jgi:hypothetical protein
MRRRKTLPDRAGYYCFSLGTHGPNYDREKWTIAEVRWNTYDGCLCFQVIGSIDIKMVSSTSPRDWGTQILQRKIPPKQIGLIPVKGEKNGK